MADRHRTDHAERPGRGTRVHRWSSATAGTRRHSRARQGGEDLHRQLVDIAGQLVRSGGLPAG